MKNSLLIAAISVCSLAANAQSIQGKVNYERVSQIQIQFSGMPDGMEQQMPKTRTDRFELNFANNQSLWKAAEEDADNGNVDVRGGDGGGMHIQMVIAGNDDVLYNNFETSQKIEKRELLGKTFIIDDSIRPFKWKMTGEQKTILNLPCIKATTTNISTKFMSNIENGKVERKEIQDTSLIEAWFTTSIPVSAGPGEYQGQLPGLILEINVNNGRQTYRATSISEKADISLIKEPSGKKHYTRAEFIKERNKMMKEMEQNNQGGNRVIRMN